MYITRMLYVWYISQQNWVILFGQILVNIPAPFGLHMGHQLVNSINS